ncbi:MAG TPA: hypothetical protein EYP49_07415 [Anaerolineae bacterium]|nr:hypothetical protein [Anaerolineae bacterium]
MILVLRLVFSLALLAPSWGGPAHAQEPTATTSPTGTPEATEALTPTTSPTTNPTETPAPTEVVIPTATMSPTRTPPTETATATDTTPPTFPPEPTATATDTPTVTPSPTETATLMPTTEPTPTPTAMPIPENPRYLRGEVVALGGGIMTVATTQGNESVAIGPEGQVLVGRRLTSVEGLRVGDVVACIVRGSEGSLATDFVLVLGHAAPQEKTLLMGGQILKDLPHVDVPRFGWARPTRTNERVYSPDGRFYTARVPAG